MAVGADDGHLSECAIFAIKKTNGTYVPWPAERGRPRPEIGSGKAARRRWPPSGWRVRCSLMPAAMLEIHDAALRVLWGLLEANPLRRCARRRRWAPSTIDYTRTTTRRRTELGSHRLRWRPRTQSPSTPATRRRRPVGLLPAGRETDLRPGLERLLSSRGKQPPPEDRKGRPFWYKRETGISSAR